MYSRKQASVACLMAALGVSACAKGPEATVENFYAAVGKGEISEAQGYLSGNIVQMLPPAKIAAGLNEEHEKIVACGGIKNIKVDLQGEGDIRTGTATVSYRGDCSEDRGNVKLALEEGAWKIQADK